MGGVTVAHPGYGLVLEADDVGDTAGFETALIQFGGMRGIKVKIAMTGRMRAGLPGVHIRIHRRTETRSH